MNRHGVLKIPKVLKYSLIIVFPWHCHVYLKNHFIRELNRFQTNNESPCRLWRRPNWFPVSSKYLSYWNKKSHQSIYLYLSRVCIEIQAYWACCYQAPWLSTCALSIISDQFKLNRSIKPHLFWLRSRVPSMEQEVQTVGVPHGRYSSHTLRMKYRWSRHNVGS